jgi:DNA-binding PadR family transcriptional regulator
LSLGEFEQVLLFALLRVGAEGHGVDLVREIEERTGRQVSPGALYTGLERLERKGLVSSWIGDSTPERGGRRRKCYRLEPAGAAELRASYTALQRLAAGMGSRLDDLAAGDAPG